MSLSTNIRRPSRAVAALAFIAILSGCAAVIDLPAVTEAPTGARVPGKIIWHDLLTHDVEASKRFYGELFGWQFEAVSAGYTLIRHEGRMIGGMIDTIALNGRNDISQWIAVMSVADIDAALERLDNGTYGLCLAGDDIIPKERLEAIPEASVCVTHKTSMF